MTFLGQELTNLTISRGMFFPNTKNLKGGIMMTRIPERTFSIGDAARLAGVSVKQIRHWQEKGYIPTLPRVVCGQRSYRQFANDDLEIIQKIKSYLDEGYTLSASAEKAATDISTKEGERDA